MDFPQRIQTKKCKSNYIAIRVCNSVVWYQNHTTLVLSKTHPTTPHWDELIGAKQYFPKNFKKWILFAKIWNKRAFLNHWPRFFNNLKIQFFQNLNFSGILGSFFSDCFSESRYSYSSGISESEFFPKLLWENSVILTFLEIWIFKHEFTLCFYTSLYCCCSYPYSNSSYLLHF